MIRKIKKTNIILSLLVIAFIIVSLSLILEMQSTLEDTSKPTIIEIEEHIDTQISHGGEQWELGCAECHFEPVYGECVDCHVPDFWVGDDNSVYFAHHDLSYTGFMDCWSSQCHDPDPEDVRYVNGDLVEGDDWHGFCDNCHTNFLHRDPDS